ncbi:hypothetical protein [Paralysiella testudinis]|uniref:Uncharacterized protein n=1 Tax=Paralysiella testudinis TaxID=2809020 RepID=A0A892ZIR0_9NEIS|nr:hypothetical protein [Paralysiella testudinis]QRQ82533.1 hypothetical protein JQU52_03800 [Paralysiella testudinis]
MIDYDEYDDSEHDDSESVNFVLPNGYTPDEHLELFYSMLNELESLRLEIAELESELVEKRQAADEINEWLSNQ